MQGRAAVRPRKEEDRACVPATWRSFVGFYSELFLLLGLSLLWWVTGGIAVGLIIVFGFPLLQVGGPFWLAPLLAIPAGPATAAMAFVARRVARELHVDRSFYWDGWKAYWRKALALNAISMVILALLLLNLIFYFTRTNVLQALALFWAYLIVFWLSVQVYLFPVLVGLKEPSIRRRPAHVHRPGLCQSAVLHHHGYPGRAV